MISVHMGSADTDMDVLPLSQQTGSRILMNLSETVAEIIKEL